MSLFDLARLRMQRIAGNLLPDNQRQYTWSLVSKKLGVNALGYRTEHDPFSGTVVDTQDRYTIVQSAPTHFVLIEACVLREPMEVGQRVTITPYARRHFDGTRVKDGATETTANGLMISKFGASTSRIPVDEPTSGLGQHLLETLFRLRCPDGVRVLSNFLVDIGASNFAFIEPDSQDPAQSSDLQLVFDCSVSSFSGRVTVGLEQELEEFYIEMHRVSPDEPEALVHRCASIRFESLAEVLTTLLGDDQWQYAHVDLSATADREVTATV